MAQAAVEWYSWIEPSQMIDGLAMAASTPGPLIQATQFVGFLAVSTISGDMHPLTAGVLASLVVTWVTFTPSFLWIFAGAPYIERLRGNTFVTSAMAAITAAVLGVTADLALWFGLHTMFAQTPEPTIGITTVVMPVFHTIQISPSLSGREHACCYIFSDSMSCQ